MPGKTATKIGHGLAKVLGIRIQYRDPFGASADPVTRGESTFSAGTADTYVEPEPTTAEWIREHLPTLHDVGRYFLNLFPFLQWIGRYNLQWFLGDLIAGKSLINIIAMAVVAHVMCRGDCRMCCCASGHGLC